MSDPPPSQSQNDSTLSELLAKPYLKGKHLLAVNQLDFVEIEHLQAVARQMRIATEQRKVLKILDGVVLGEIFYEPSTRTSTSFDAAMKRVGGQTAILNESYSRPQMGDSLEAPIRTVGQYVDAIVLRHPDENAIDAAAAVSPVPIINGGNGAKEHPTQGLLDLLTIKEELGAINGLLITFVGDLRYGRTVHSLCELLRHYRVRINLCSPPSLEMPSELAQQIRDRGQLGLISTELSPETVRESDVIYCTRVQKERFTDLELYEKVKNSLKVDPGVMKEAKSNMILMHPLPRNEEVASEVDKDPRAAYFRQVNSTPVRGAVVHRVRPLTNDK